MVCDKCGYKDIKEIKKGPFTFCRICSVFSPNTKQELKKFVEEKVSWKSLDSYRKYGVLPGSKQKEGMGQKAKEGKIIARPPRGYTLSNGLLQPNKDSLIIYRLFRDYLKSKESNNFFAKKNKMSLNTLKNILTNRTYLGEIKFEGNYYKSTHKPLVDEDLFYAVQRKIKENKTI